ncbi:PAS domain S-box protein [Leptolyngbya sp. AN02str]|uniref:PAS domain S-box protein n=1 Tax=Leptolyngbya sp. AN02str TaxID=3423363 RepID=UPI003D3244FF
MVIPDSGLSGCRDAFQPGQSTPSPLNDPLVQALMEASWDAIAITNEAGQFIAVNSAACDFCGTTQRDMLGTPLQAWIEPKWWQHHGATLLQHNRGRAIVPLHRANAERQEVQCSVVHHPMAGWRVWVWRELNPRPQSEGLAMRSRVEQPQSLIALSDQRYQALADQYPEPMCRFLPDGTLTFANRAWCEAVGQSEVVGHNLLNWEDGGDRDRTVDLLNQCLALSPAQPSLTVDRLLTALATEHSVWHVQALFDEQQQVVEFQAISQDTRERHQLSLDLEACKRKYQTIFDNLPIGLAITNAAGHIVEVNPISEEILGISNTVHTTRSYDSAEWRVIRPDGTPVPVQEYAGVRALTEQRVVRDEEMGIVHPDRAVSDCNVSDHNIVWISVTASPIPLPDYGVAIAYIDITHRKEIELAYRDSEERFRSIFNNVSVGVALADLEGRLVLANEFDCRFLGYSADELVGMHFADFTHPEDVAIDATNLQQLLDGEIPSYVIEKRYITKQQTIVWARLTVSLVRHDDGTIRYVASVCEDITERHKAEQERDLAMAAQRQLSQRLALATNAAKIGIWDLDLRDGSLFWDLHMYELYNVQSLSGAITGDLWHQCVHPDDRDMVSERVQRAIATGDRLHTDFRILWPNGDIRYIEGHGIVLHDADGQPERLIGVNWDITERKHIEQDLLNTRNHLQVILASSPAIIYALSPEQFTPAVYLSDNLTAITGYSVERALSDANWFTSCVLPHDFSQFVERFQQWRNAGAPNYLSFRYRFQKADGSWAWFEDRLVGIRDDAGELVELVGVMTDVSAQVEAEYRLEQISRQIPGAILQYRRFADGRDYFPYVSHGIQELHGLTPEDLHHDGSQMYRFVHPDDLDLLQQSIAQSAETLSPWRCEYRVCLPNGHTHWIEGHASVQPEPDGGTLWHGYLIDVTQRKEVEAALWESDARWQFALEGAGDGVWDWKIDTNEAYYSPQWKALLGYDVDEMTNNTLQVWESCIYPPEAVSDCWAAIAAHLEGRAPLYQASYQVRCRDGSYKWILDRGKVMAWDAEGRPLRMIGTISDISSQKQAEERLRQQAAQERLRSSMTAQIRQSLNLQEILDTTVAEVRQYLQCDRVLVYQFNSDMSGIVIAEAVHTAYQSLLGQTLYDAELTQPAVLEPFLQGYIQNTADIYTANLSECYVAFLERMQVRATLILPLLQQQHLWGFLVAQHCQEPRVWQPEEISLLRQLSSQVTMAIEQSELYRQVQHLNTNLELQVRERTAELEQSLAFEALLKRITDQVRDSLDEKTIVRTVVRELAQGLEVDCCDTGLYNDDLTVSTIAYEYTTLVPSMQGHSFVMAETACADIYPTLFQGEICQFCNVHPVTLRFEGNHLTVLACPIVDDQGILGDLWLFKSCDRVFDEMEVKLVAQVANQCAIALRQSRLYCAAQNQVLELERLNQLKDDFLNTVSHELRTPISSIEMTIQLIQLTLKQQHMLNDAESSQLEHYFQILHDECQREINLINNLLELARLDSQTEPILLTEICLLPWISHIADAFYERMLTQEQQLEIDIPEDLVLNTDLIYIERILTELLNNACKYTPSGERIRISAQRLFTDSGSCNAGYETSHTIGHALAYSSATQNTIIQLRIQNTGVMIPASECDRIFDKFYRIPNTDPWRHGGTGLGLALVKKLVEYLGASIRVESSHNQTSFVLEFPPLS